MKYNEVNWAKAWRGLSIVLLREGYCSMKAVEKWAKENNFVLRMINDVIDALAVERFDHDGEIFFRLSGKVVPLLPRDVREVSTYRQAAVAYGGGAA